MEKAGALVESPGLFFVGCGPKKLQLDDVGCSRAFVTFYDVERYPVTLVKRLETIGLDGGEVHEYVVTVLALNESKAFLFIEPLHNTLKTHTKNLR
jgi:hypothetical protein